MPLGVSRRARVAPSSSFLLLRERGSESRPPADILRLNDWLRNYATQIHAQVADYHSALVDSHGMLREGYSDDGLHPNDRGYALMAPVAGAAIEKALKE